MLDMKVDDFVNVLKNGPYAWPGGYPLYFVGDGFALCFKCAEEEQELVKEAIKSGDKRDEWLVQAHDVNWESEDLYCDHCSKQIESAYGGNDDDDDNN